MPQSSPPSAPDRIRLAVDLVDPRPGERILEVGSGTVVSIALLLEREPHLTVVSLDRSPAATARVGARHAATVEDGRVILRTGALGELRLDPADPMFDKVLAVNVNAFWTGTAQLEIDAIKGVLREGGTLTVVYGAPAKGMVERDVAPHVVRALRVAGFSDVSNARSPEGTAIHAIR